MTTTHPQRAPADRKVKWASRLVGLAAGAAFVAAFHASLGDVLTENEMLQKDGIETRGAVSAVHCYGNPATRPKHGAVPPVVQYTYQVGAVKFSGWGGVPSEYHRPECDKLSAGTALPVTYSAAHPEVSRPYAAASVHLLPRHSTYWVFEAIMFAVLYFGTGAIVRAACLRRCQKRAQRAA